MLLLLANLECVLLLLLANVIACYLECVLLRFVADHCLVRGLDKCVVGVAADLAAALCSVAGAIAAISSPMSWLTAGVVALAADAIANTEIFCCFCLERAQMLKC